MRLSIGKRLFLGFLLLLSLEIAIVGLGIFNIARLSKLNQRSIRSIEPLDAVYELLLGFEEIVMPINDYIMHGNPVEKEVYKIKKEELEKHILKVKGLFPIVGGPAFLHIADSQFQHIRELADKVFGIERPIGSMEAAMLMEETDAFADKAWESIDAYHEEYLDKQLDSLREESSQIVKNSIFLFLSFSFLGLGLSFILAYLLARRVQRPIVYLEAACKRLARGYLEEKVEIKTQDEFEELAKTFNQMAIDLNRHEQEIKEANEELSKWSRLLEERVEERTRELRLAQVQLVQVAKMAAIGQLAGGVAHEINNPLTGVLNNVQLIKMEAEAKKDFALSDFKELLDIVEESALRCKQITQGLLDFSRVGKRPHQPSNINQVLENTLILAEREIRLENIKLIKELSDGFPLVSADPNQLQQVFLDILNNAKWALQNRQGAEIKIKTSTSQDKKTVVTQISDNGCGIEKEDLPRIFEPFFTTKKPQEGTGLGLSICYGIIKEHNGTIEAESEGKDKGATFRITLPAIPI